MGVRREESTKRGIGVAGRVGRKGGREVGGGK